MLTNSLISLLLYQQHIEGMIGMHKRLVIAIIFVLFLSLVLVSIPVKAQTTNSIVINPDGSVTGTYSIQQVGNTYTFISNISGSVQVSKSGITIDGSGYCLNGGIDLTNGIGANLPSSTRPEITDVTVENLFLNGGIGTNGGGNDTFYNDYFLGGNVEYGSAAIFLLGCSYNNISYCNFANGSQISMDYSAAFNTVTECNLPSYGVLVWLSGYETVDRNYWVDYSTKNPNVSEVDHTGVGNQPYVYYSTQDTSPNGTIIPTIYQDSHPLMKPVTIPLIGLTPTPTPYLPPRNPPHLDPIVYLIPVSVLAVVIVLSVLLSIRHRKTTK